MERHLDRELTELKQQLLKMGTLVEAEIFGSVEALKELDIGMANKVITEDRVIDEMENAIDERCLDLLALRQPMAIDLRFITMSMKISTDLERIADLAVDIAQRVQDLAGKPLLKPLIDIPRLTNLAQQMIKDALDAFVNKDAELAGSVILRDNEADKLRNLVQKELVDDYMSKDPATASRAVPLLLIARHLERICDHATNIAEDVIYMVNAKVVKHHPEELGKKKVLFVCVHNSARSQMAEAFLKQLAGDRFEVESAGLEPGKLNPLAIEAMKEIGIDISQNKTKSAFDFYKQNRLYDFVIAVCDQAQAQRCPTFPGTIVTKSIGWSFPDPATFQGIWEEKLDQTRQVRDKIKQQIEQWLKTV